MSKALGENLRRLRVKENYSQRFIAEKLEINDSSYSRIERGDQELSADGLAKIAEIYKMTLDQIYNFDEKGAANSPPDYSRRQLVPITVSLDGTEETLNMWTKKLKEINGVI